LEDSERLQFIQIQWPEPKRDNKERLYTNKGLNNLPGSLYSPGVFPT